MKDKPPTLNGQDWDTLIGGKCECFSAALSTRAVEVVLAIRFIATALIEAEATQGLQNALGASGNLGTCPSLVHSFVQIVCSEWPPCAKVSVGS